MEYRRFILSSLGASYRHVVKPAFFRLPPEFVHQQMTNVGFLLGSSSLMKVACGNVLKNNSPLLSQQLAGISFENPIGLSAGFDYGARLTQILPALGFGFGTVGTITNMPYGGNPPPMLGRLPKSRSLLVNKGFKNNGALATKELLEKYSFAIPIGISIGRTNTPYLDTVKKSVRDILTAFEIFENSNLHHAYYELNISCPNVGAASGLFYDTYNLSMLLEELDRMQLERPIFVKMPIEKDNTIVLSLLDVLVKHKVMGVIFGNLQKNRSDKALDPEEVKRFQKGNFSGKPTYQRSNELIALCYRHFGERFIIIGSGGVFSAADAYEKILLGASLVQLITGMIFQGPQLIAEINMGLIDLLGRDGFKNISEAVGTRR